MKNIVIYFFCMSTVTAVQAQTFSEWFRQKKTQEKYLVQQIAGLKVYAGYLKKGYEIFDKRSKTISRIKNGDFDMHHLFFSAKSRLNPNLSGPVKDMGIASLKNAVLVKCGQSRQFLLLEPNFANKQKEYFRTVLARAEKNAEELFSDYQDLIEPDKTTMDDEERLKRLANLKREYLSLYRFASSWNDEIRWYSQQIKDGQNDISSSRTILGLK